MTDHAGPSRRSFLAMSTAALAAATSLAQASPAPRRRPNIVFILADDLGIGDLGCYGQQRIATPNIDRLAREGVQFDQAYAGAPICSPSRCSLMTGLHTGHARIRGNFAIAGGRVGSKGKSKVRRANLLPGDTTIGDRLRPLGYRAGLMGKWHLDGYDPGATPLQHGFDEFSGWLIQEEQTQGYFPTKRYRAGRLEDIDQDRTKGAGMYETDLCTADACDFIRRNAANPFFLFVGYSAPHSPYISPALSRYAGKPWTLPQKSYAAMIELLDQGVGGIMRALEEAGLDGDTIVMFTSDNGARSEATAEQTSVVEFFGSNGGDRGYKRNLTEGGLHIPFLARWPGRIRGGTRQDVPIYFPDVLPTAVGLAGGTLAEGASDGIDLSATLTRNAPLSTRFLYWETIEPEFSQAVRWGRWKAIRATRGGTIALYDLLRDPQEQRDVSAANAAVVAEIERYLRTARRSSVEYP